MRWAIAAVELYWLIWFFVIGIEAFMQRAAGLKSPFDVLEFHHAYIGAAFVALGFWLHTVTGIFVQLLGVVFTVDDLIQHAIQTYSDDTAYQSPLHQLFARTLWRVPGIPKLVEFLDSRWWALVLLGGLAMLALGCSSASVVPMVRRPDTRALSGVLLDSSTIVPVILAIRAAYPNEVAVCLYGELRDTVIDDWPRRIVSLHRMRVAAADSVNFYHVYFPRVPRSGCDGPGLIGEAHSHVYALEPLPCTHSDQDVGVLFRDPRLLFSLIYCGDGRAELFYQDGRRVPDMWLRQAPAPP